MEHDDIDTVLAKRMSVPAARADLAERIIHRAIAAMPLPVRSGTVWTDMLSMLALPHPSVLVAASVILGLMFGVQAGDGLFSLQQDWTSFLDINEGGWL